MSRAILLSLCLALPSSTMGQGFFSMRRAVRYGQAKIDKRYEEVMGERLGRYVATKFKGKRALILLPPESFILDYGKDVDMPHMLPLQGLRKGMKRLVVVDTIKPKMPAAVRAKIKRDSVEKRTMMPNPRDYLWFGVRELNQELERYKGTYDVLVCLTSLPGVDLPPLRSRTPVGFEKLRVWQEKGVSVALLDVTVVGLRPLIQSGKICAAATYKRNLPHGTFEIPPARNLNKAFDTRFLLITPDNVSEYPTYFQK